MTEVESMDLPAGPVNSIWGAYPLQLPKRFGLASLALAALLLRVIATLTAARRHRAALMRQPAGLGSTSHAFKERPIARPKPRMPSVLQAAS